VVSQQQDTSSVTEEQQILELAKTVEVDDTTQPEVDAAADAETQTKQQRGSVAQPQQGGNQPQVGGTPETTPVQSAPGTDLSQIPEWRQAQSKYDQQIAQLQQQVAQTEHLRAQEAGKQQVEAAVEADLRIAEQRLAPEMGDDEARKQVRAQGNVQAVREFHETKAKATQLETEVQSRDQLLEHAGKLVAVDQFVAAYNVADSDKELLLTTSTPQQMETLAQRLGQKTAQTNQARSAVPPETPETTLEAGESSAPTGGSFWSLIDSAQDKHWSDMNAAERDAVTRVAEGRIPE
jgi:hypothetical protein